MKMTKVLQYSKKFNLVQKPFDSLPYPIGSELKSAPRPWASGAGAVHKTAATLGTVLRVKIFKEISLGLILTRGLFTLEKMAYPRVKIVSPRLISLKISPLGYWYQQTSTGTGTIFFFSRYLLLGKLHKTILERNQKNYLVLDFFKQNYLNSAQVPDLINIRSWLRICIKLFWSHKTR